MLKLVDEWEFTWPVTVRIPDQGGDYRTAGFTATFAALAESRVRQIIETATREGESPDAELLRAVLRGWSEVQDSQDQTLVFSEYSRNQLIDVPFVRAGLIAAYFEALGGAAEKN